jgi:hypothetical protein
MATSRQQELELLIRQRALRDSASCTREDIEALIMKFHDLSKNVMWTILNQARSDVGELRRAYEKLLVREALAGKNCNLADLDKYATRIKSLDAVSMWLTPLSLEYCGSP